VYFCTLCSSIDPKERSQQALDREIWVAKGLFEIILSLKKLSISRMLLAFAV
jgi:hypothetical protein